MKFVKVVKCSQTQAWYNNHIGKVFKILKGGYKFTHHQGSHHGMIHEVKKGWIFVDDVKEVGLLSFFFN